MNFHIHDPQTNWRYIGVVILLGFFVGGLVIWYGKSTPEAPAPEVSFTKPSLQEGKEKINTLTWQTYRSEEFGFEVRYPAEWQAIEAKSGNSTKECCIGVLLENELQKVTFRREDNEYWPAEFEIRVVSNIGRFTLEEWSNKLYISTDVPGEQRDARIRSTNIILYGMPARQDSIFQFDRTVIAIATLYKGNFYALKFDGNNPNDPKFDMHKKIYDQILSTFRFVE